MPRTSGPARVYLHPEPEAGAHPGFRGDIEVDATGVHLTVDCELLTVPDVTPGEAWPMGSWDYIERPTLLPWNRVDVVEWLSAEDLAEQREREAQP